MKTQSFVTIKEVEEIYKEECKEFGMKFSKKEFKKFLEFLSVDVYDWVKSNLKLFS